MMRLIDLLLEINHCGPHTYKEGTQLTLPIVFIGVEVLKLVGQRVYGGKYQIQNIASSYGQQSKEALLIQEILM